MIRQAASFPFWRTSRPATVVPPGVVTAAKTADSKPDLKLHEDTQAGPEPPDSEQEPQEQSKAVPSDEEQGGDAEPDDKR